MSYTYRGADPAPALPVKPRLKSGPKPKPFNPGLCGTRAGYKQHVRFRDVKCRACLDSAAVYQRELRAARKAAA
jgi:hypothetical protein